MTANGGPLPPRDHDSDQVLAALQPGYIIPKSQLKGVNQLIQEALDRAASMSPEQVDAEYAARRAVYDGKHRA